MKLKDLAIVLSLLLCSIATFAQTTSTIEGKVVDENGEPLPGVLVSLASPAMQGTRTAVSRANGIFLFRLLNPGTYTATMTMDGMRTEKAEIRVGLGQTSRPTVTMRPATTSETLVITASADPVLDTTTGVANFDKDFIDKIASGRTQTTIAALAPGTAAAAFGGRVSIAGAPTHANQYLVNGIDSRFDNLRGGAGDAVIEDAIQETSVMTSSISAEYGNFGGGVVNTITKSGGNEFSGSLRLALSNPSWANQNPIEREGGDFEDTTNKAWTATLGGPIIKDRLWFFVAGYKTERTISQFFTQPSVLTSSLIAAYGLDENQTVPGPRQISGRMNNDERIEFKLTGQIAEGHDLIYSYTKRDDEQFNNGSAPFDESGLWPYRNIPRELWSVNYRGIINDSFSVDVVYSERESVFEERPSGHIEGDTRITGTLLRDRRTFGRFNSALFLGKPDEPRGNETSRIKANYFTVTNWGSHDLVFGVEDFKDYRFANNRQSLNDFQLWTDVRWEGNTPVPIFQDGSTGGYRTRIIYYPIENPSLTSDLGVLSGFVNDTWTFNEKWRFNVGLRYDDREAKSEDGTLVADDNKLSPRLSVEYDLHGDGKHQFTVGYATYVQRTGQGSQDGSQAGSPGFAWFDYLGPQTENYLDVIQWVNDTYGDGFWFDPLNHPNRAAWEADLVINDLYDPGSQSVVIGQVNPSGGFTPGTLDSPEVNEIRIGYQTRFGNKGFLKADFLERSFDDFYVSNTNLLTGPTANGQNDLSVYNNNDEEYERHYYAVLMQGRWRFSKNFNVLGNYTWSQTYGNINGQSADGVSNTAGTTTDYPEYNTFPAANPSGYLAADQRHVANIFLVYDLNTNFGSFNFSATQRYESGTPYYNTVLLPLSTNSPSYGLPARAASGYVAPPSETTYFIDGRSAHRAESMTQTNLGVNWQLPISKLDVFLEIDIFNIFDEENAFIGASYNTTSSPEAQFDVFNETPVEGVNYTLDEDWGTPSTGGAYQTSRTYRFDVGIRF
jgi:hypothetical protein